MSKPVKRKFNIVDIIIIVIIICVIVAGGKVFRKFSSGSKGGNETVYFEFMGTKVRYEGANKVKPGDKVYNSTNSTYLGVVDHVEVTPYYEPVFDPTEGIYEEVELPNKCNVDIFVESNGYVTDSGVFPEGQELKVGQEFFLKGKGYAFEGYIVGVDE
ncbi:MAG: DUF4330 domain-containing protein [Firmicutes bacterium]|nr:DUF4330 domain-containing protein [Bacillota bacterium]MBR0104002.1 DUF4330 domain-containing protein [Bacillota bacterium]MBR2593132.1 DUF4330 domain-containing protein [Bacillota bacterium]